MNPKFVVPFVALLLAVVTVQQAVAQSSSAEVVSIVDEEVIYHLESNKEISFIYDHKLVAFLEDGQLVIVAPQWREIIEVDENSKAIILEPDLEVTFIDEVTGMVFLSDELELVFEPVPSMVPSATYTHTPEPTATSTFSPTPSPTATATRTPSPVPTGTPVPTATATFTPTPTATIIPLSCNLQKQDFSIDEEIAVSITGNPWKVVELLYLEKVIGERTLNEAGTNDFFATYEGPGGDATITCRYKEIPEMVSVVTAFVTIPATATATFTPTATATQASANELEYYHASPTTDKILLEWATEREVNIVGFEIFRKLVSDPNTAYQSIGSRIALGSSVAGATYNFEVTSDLVPGELYCFRLREITTDGTPGDAFDLCGYGLTPVATSELEISTQAAEIVPQQNWLRSIFNWENVSRYWWIFLIMAGLVAAFIAAFVFVERRKRRTPSPPSWP